MQPIAEAFLETNWDDAAAAKAERDQRATQLQAAGYDCTCSDLWNVVGYRVYVVTAEPAEAKPTREHRRSPASVRPQRPRIASPGQRPVVGEVSASSTIRDRPSRRRIKD
jgi:hypothetical protein